MRSELQTHAEGAGSRAMDRRIYTYRDLGGGAGAEVRRPRLWRDSDHVRQLGEPSVHEPLPAAVSTISPARGCPSSVAPRPSPFSTYLPPWSGRRNAFPPLQTRNAA